MAEEPESGVLVRSWRTAFLTLRDETLSHPTNPMASIVPLLDELIFSNFRSFVAAASHLPRHEVKSDLMYLLNLAASSCCGGNEDADQALSQICHLIRSVTIRVPLEITPSSWSHMLESFGKLAKYFIENSVRKGLMAENSSAIKAAIDCLETTRHLIGVDPQRSFISENIHLVRFLLHIVVCCHSQLNGCYHSGGDVRFNGDLGKRFTKWTGLWKVQTTAFAMVAEAFSRVGSCFPMEIWQSVVEVLRKVMDALTTKLFVFEDGVLSRFYAALLHCLHVVLINRKGSFADHVAAFVATLRMFLLYGLSPSSCYSDRDLGSSSPGLSSKETFKKDVGAYKPPHMRRRKNCCLQQRQIQTSQTSSDYDSSPVEFSSSDSDYSDSDGALKSSNNVRSCKARIAAMTCIQVLCEADRKAFIAQWTMLLPTNDVLHPRKFEATLMTSLLFDPFLKARLASASTIASMLEGPSAVALQVAEYKESTRCGSYMALSSSLGQILMQLHSGVLHLIQHEKHTGLLTSLFKILILLISSTPYARMPAELLPRVILSLRLRIEEGFPFINDQTSLLVTAINCLTAAVSTSPSSLHVNKMFEAEISAGLSLGKGGPGVLITLFKHAEQATNPTISLEALQALKAVCHNYPNAMAACWKLISSITSQILKLDTFRIPLGKGAVGHDTVSTVEKIVTAAIRVMDECLRAVSGFKGTEDLFGDKLLDTPFASECVRDKKISSAPSYGLETLRFSEDNLAGSREWCDAIEKHLVSSLCHPSAMVRAASVTCFAGITCSVFFSLEKQQQQFILSSCINAASDSFPSVRSAACRAIGVIACFPDILRSSGILNKFFSAVESNTHDQLVSVRIAASWAMANICDSFRHSVCDSSLDLEVNVQFLASLLECSLRLTRDGDKVKSNAVRALGNLSRVIPFGSPHSQENSSLDTYPPNCCMIDHNAIQSSSLGSLMGLHLLEKIVQAFLSSITTGNVKVQWNVCHALSNLFLNESLRMQQMDWASPLYSILLLLLRDSPNFKIRIQAAAALAVPLTIDNYGNSFSDIVRGIEQSLENVVADHNLSPSFKYRVALEKQLTASMLHVLGLCSSGSDDPMKEFLLKKASFLEGWLKDLCVSLETNTQQEDEEDPYSNQKRALVSKAMSSLIEVYESKTQPAAAQKLRKMLEACG